MLFFLLFSAMINSYGAYYIVLGEEIFYMAKTNNSQKKSTKNSTKRTTAKNTKRVATAKKSANTKSVKSR